MIMEDKPSEQTEQMAHKSAAHQHDQHKPLASAAGDPTCASRWLASALIAAAVLLVVAAGAVLWLMAERGLFGSKVASIVTADPNNTRNVTAVSFVLPADFPANYLKNDQSTHTATNTYYYDEATNCGLIIGVAAPVSDSSPQVVATEAFNAGWAPGIKTLTSNPGESVDLKDVDGKATYSFNTLNLTQEVKVDGVAFTAQNAVLMYKQFGPRAAWLAVTCKSETWEAKKDELTALAKQLTIKTER